MCYVDYDKWSDERQVLCLLPCDEFTSSFRHHICYVFDMLCNIIPNELLFLIIIITNTRVHGYEGY